ncbi:MAG: bifunctional UDP-N-acetylglucosamine diphosphorylase/glucosamine-1-phosphate N-acetyltransferase GlmU [Oscillatoriales cyanobacterium SM2_2_1]|nr:bifunctional UDP-N-acetylglucosamine diphosphorylase/glucosamine-1-phosphate N-acetyltransferase GlmU [Oscillatoriales cyanobacterium SM2_2_1]
MLAVAILAAGKGTRMKSDLPKVLQPLAGQSLVERVIMIARTLHADRYLVIVGYGSEQVKKALAHIPDLTFVEQHEQLGTGHAIQQVVPYLKDFTGTLVVLTGDSPLLRAETVQDLAKTHEQSESAATVLTAVLPDPSGYGRVFCDQYSYIERIIEHRDCNAAQRKNRRVSTGVYCFRWADLAAALPRLTTNNDQKEYYLTEVFNFLTPVLAHDVADYEESFGINDRQQLAHAYDVLQARVRSRWMDCGVTMILPETITIDDTVELAANVTLEPHTHLRGNTKIGAHSHIGPSSYIENSTIGEHCTVLFSVLTHSQVGDGCRVGPYTHIRQQTVVGDRCRVGNFVEIKNSQLGSLTNAAHLSYLGDATLGSHVNIGAGTVTANYDGFNKFRTEVGDHTKTGSNSVLVAPITVGKNVNIGAGSVITTSIPDNALAIARLPPVIKPDYYDDQGKKRAVQTEN